MLVTSTVYIYIMDYYIHEYIYICTYICTGIYTLKIYILHIMYFNLFTYHDHVKYKI